MKKLVLFPFILFFYSAFSQVVNLDSSELPIVILDTRGKTIANEPKILAYMRIIYNGPGKINRISDKSSHYSNFIAIEIRGNSSQSYPQKQYGLELRDSLTGLDIDTSLLGMPTDEDWVLYAPYNDISMLRNVLTYKLWNEMGHWGPRTRLCEVILNNVYQGVYVFTESIKRSPDRVDIAKLKPEDTSGLELTGGYIMKIDKKNNATDKSFISKVKSTNQQNITWLYHYPESDDIVPSQENYIHRYIDTVEQVISSANFSDPVNGFRKYLSTLSFMDYFILTEFSRNIDAYKASSYFYKEKMNLDGSGGQFKAGPVWDYNFAFGNASFCSGAQSTGWMYDGCMPATLPTPVLWKRLLQDANYLNDLRCRYNILRRTILDTTYIFNFLNSYSEDTLKNAQKRHFTKWPILGTNPGGFNGYISASYSDEMRILKNWIRSRLNWMDANFQGTCTPTNLKLQIPIRIPCNNNSAPTLQANQPFDVAPFHYSGKEKYTKNNSELIQWVLVEIRSSKDSTKIIDRRAALLKSDNSVVDTNLSNTIFFPLATPNENYFVLVRFDMHAFILSKSALKIPNNSALNLNQASFTNLPLSSSPIIYNSNWIGFDSITICQGNKFIINDSNLVKLGFNNLLRSSVGTGLQFKDIDEHQLELIATQPGEQQVQIFHRCNDFYFIRAELKVKVLKSPEVKISGEEKACKDKETYWSVNGNKIVWSTGSTSTDIKLSVSGTYTVTVSDINGCTSTSSKEFQILPPVMGNINHIAAWSMSECKIFFTPDQNYGPLSYQWSNGATTDTVVTSLSTIHLKVTDIHGCVTEYSKDCAPLNVISLNENEVEIYPNPGDGIFHIHGKNIIGVRIFNSASIPLSNKINQSSADQWISTSLNAGIYTIVIDFINQSKAYKVVVID